MKDPSKNQCHPCTGELESTLPQFHGLRAGGCCSCTRKQVHCFTRRNLTGCRRSAEQVASERDFCVVRITWLFPPQPESQPLPLSWLLSPNPYASRHSRISLAFENQSRCSCRSSYGSLFPGVGEMLTAGQASGRCLTGVKICGLTPGLPLPGAVSWVEGMTVWCHQGDQPLGLARVSVSSLDVEFHVFKWTPKPKAKSRVNGSHDATSEQMF